MIKGLDAWITREPRFAEPRLTTKCACCGADLHEDEVCYRIGSDNDLYCADCIECVTAPPPAEPEYEPDDRD